MTVPKRLEALRIAMKKAGIDAWIVPSSDPHQSEYVANRWSGRSWISGFSGSAGTVIILADKAGLWTDSRYFLQAAAELSGSGIDLYKEGLPETPSMEAWLKSELAEGSVVGFDGAVMSVSQVNKLRDQLAGAHIQLKYDTDLLDAIWPDREAMPGNPVFLLDDSITGETCVSKVKRICEKMIAAGAQYTILPALDDIAWTFNMRGADVEYNPVAYAWAVIARDSVHLFIRENKLSADVKKKMEQDKVTLHDYDAFLPWLSKLNGAVILIDPERTNQKIRDAIPGTCTVTEKPSIAFDLKAVKNETELQGVRHAHIRDGAAMVKWLYWLENNINTGKHTEITLADKLEAFRRENDKIVGLSFTTIAGYRGNGAIVHYSAKPETAAEVKPEGLLLMDSGGQYMDGTTDITRTISLGKPTDEEKHCFTLVLKGHIDLAKAIFPKGYNGSQVDTFARAAMWADYKNYGHGTGHGVGHFLNVHEGPQRIRPENTVPLEPGMLTSNEPGIYIEGKFGIRIENLVITIVKKVNEYGTFYGFETVTLCPISLDLIDVDMLTGDEKAWLNTYHKQVYEKLSPLLNAGEKDWLKNQTRAI